MIVCFFISQIRLCGVIYKKLVALINAQKKLQYEIISCFLCGSINYDSAPDNSDELDDNLDFNDSD